MYPNNDPKIDKNGYYENLNDYGDVGHPLIKPDTNFHVYPSTAKREKRLESILP